MVSTYANVLKCLFGKNHFHKSCFWAFHAFLFFKICEDSRFETSRLEVYDLYANLNSSDHECGPAKVQIYRLGFFGAFSHIFKNLGR